MDSTVDFPPGKDTYPLETDKRGELGLDISVPFLNKGIHWLKINEPYVK